MDPRGCFQENLHKIFFCCFVSACDGRFSLTEKMPTGGSTAYSQSYPHTGGDPFAVPIPFLLPFRFPYRVPTSAMKTGNGSETETATETESVRKTGDLRPETLTPYSPAR